jgi:Tfp pilus assembly protein PilN
VKININLLPPEYRPRPWVLPVTLVLVIAVAAVGYYGYSFYQKNISARSELEGLQSQLDSVNAETIRVMGQTQAPANDVEEYEQRIADAQAEIDALGVVERDYEKRNGERIYWKPVLQAIEQLAPNAVILTSFSQVGNEITVEGELGGEEQNAIWLVDFHERLAESGLFSNTVLEINTDPGREVTIGGQTKTMDIFTFKIYLEVKPGG